jgi:hypothetical protein
VAEGLGFERIRRGVRSGYARVRIVFVLSSSGGMTGGVGLTVAGEGEDGNGSGGFLAGPWAVSPSG